MPKKLFKRLTINSQGLKEHKMLARLGTRIHDPNLWHLNRHSVSRAFFASLFTSITLMIFPCHMITAAFMATWIRANLPISVALVWLINPITIPPLAIAALKIGLWVIPGSHSRNVQQLLQFNWESNATLGDKISHFWHLFEKIWQPFMLGSLTLGLLVGAASYVLIQGFWRLHVGRSWVARRKRRQQEAQG